VNCTRIAITKEAGLLLGASGSQLQSLVLDRIGKIKGLKHDRHHAAASRLWRQAHKRGWIRSSACGVSSRSTLNCVAATWIAKASMISPAERNAREFPQTNWLSARRGFPISELQAQGVVLQDFRRKPFSSPRRTSSSTYSLTLRGGMHQASRTQSDRYARSGLGLRHPGPELPDPSLQCSV